ncbi:MULTISPECIES: chlorophyll synthase ChlG [Methylobacterium]|uniref:1,4-dihydroxy-2-naphthoate octaprenyltransferase n=1 Tax=Methylobacterium bullatum TaxID=570505 RepID=A0AAV4Z6Z8_9HYPH|nr:MULTISPECIES: chlorophyll synthase ChlG [Methylobacterium]KQP09517.1 bacteriochlorophyll/chlorophyll a synthase [Methylobacterium sp. Leaf93]MBD8903148.1 bacteriochlorophyll/chlorophyll a synthase [Methylobacterium bullatum]GJD39949.1 1,4-dihydroxy-2-naphthoate octaprenyltransferase [Methylobacterium bullatum]
MATSVSPAPSAIRGLPAPSALLELLKPITWFAPMWAFACGVVSSGVPASGHWPVIVAGIVLAGPLVCATSQAANDWYDRHVDAINEPNRPIPSGRMPGRWGLYVALAWTALSLSVAAALGVWILYAALFGLVLAWIYSAPPLRLKQNGWWGNAAVGLCYEGLPWFTGAAVMAGALPDHRILTVAFLYSVGAHGIMTLNDFKSVEGDARMNLRSLPVQLGTDRAARLACLVMALPQLAVIALLYAWDRSGHAVFVAGLLAAQLVLMSRLLKDPRGRAAWYNGTGTTLYVLGMLVAAFALRALAQQGAA